MAQVGRALKSRIERLDEAYQELPGSQRVFREETIKSKIFESKERSGNDVLLIENIVKKYGSHTALNLENLRLSIRRGELFIISGENGSGKSTLLRVINSVLTQGDFLPDHGQVHVGSGIESSYFAPDNLGIGKKGSIFSEVKNSTDNLHDSEVSSILHFWGFPKESIRTKKIEQLSAGEKKQLAFAMVMARRSNLLLLDEPTDYLKQELIDRLSHAINGFDGTTILISHNKNFLDSLRISRELVLPDRKIILKDGYLK
jgi:ATP-binding cassette subfamily F protein 3